MRGKGWLNYSLVACLRIRAAVSSISWRLGRLFDASLYFSTILRTWAGGFCVASRLFLVFLFMAGFVMPDCPLAVGTGLYTCTARKMGMRSP
jgi:hypothetical protein